MIYLIIAIVVLLAVLGFVWSRRQQKSADGMSNFRRQIDALSPEARRPVVDQVQRAAGDEDQPRRPVRRTDERDG